jgi:hypothetical protein
MLLHPGARINGCQRLCGFSRQPSCGQAPQCRIGLLRQPGFRIAGGQFLEQIDCREPGGVRAGAGDVFQNPHRTQVPQCFGRGRDCRGGQEPFDSMAFLKGRLTCQGIAQGRLGSLLPGGQLLWAA